MPNLISIGSSEIRQVDGLYSLNDLHKASEGVNKHRPNYFLENKQTKDLISEIQIAGIPAITKKPKIGTYVCKELVIAYAAWISPAFHLNVIRVFLENQKPPVPKIDVKSLLQENHYELVAVLPPEILDAIDKKAWEMTGEAYELFRDYLKRHIAGCQYGEACQHIYVNNALEAISKTMIGNAMAHTYYSEIECVERAVEFTIYKAEKALRKIRGAKSGQVLKKIQENMQ